MRYAVCNGDRITTVFEYDGVSSNPFGHVEIKKLPDEADASWVGKSYSEATTKGARAKVGLRAEEMIVKPISSRASSGEEMNQLMGNAAMAAEHSLDPDLGSEVLPDVGSPAEQVARKVFKEMFLKEVKRA